MLWEHLKENNSKTDAKFEQVMSLIATQPTTVVQSGTLSRRSLSRDQSKNAKKRSSDQRK